MVNTKTNDIVWNMIPIKDRNPCRSLPVVTFILIISNVYIFFRHNMSMNPHQLAAFFKTFGTIPDQFFPSKDLTHFRSTLISLFASMFLHGGVLHITGNMLYLWIFGDNVEDRLGHIYFFFFYIFCGLGATIAHIALSPHSNVPMIGASGAIAGVLGAYLILFPRVRVLTIIPIFFFFKLVELPAILVLGFWFGVQFLNGYYALQDSGAVGSSGVAWFSHVGGFLLGTGWILVLNIRRKI